MTILPELRAALVRAEAPLILPELRDGLARTRPRRARRRRPLVVGMAGFGALLATAGALAATGVLALGDPVEPRHVERDPAHGVGVPVGSTARLLPLRVPDPAGGPPWGLRLVTTSRGLGCIQIGRVVGDELGVLGQDGVAGNDGRFHPLPVATAGSHMTPCQHPDGAGRFFVGVDRLTYASGDSTERTCPGRDARKTSRPPCPVADERLVGYGLLGPRATRVAFADGSSLELNAPEGAYLSVRRAHGEQGVTSMGGGPAVGVFDAAVTRIDYRDGTVCPAPGSRRAFCPPKGVTARPRTTVGSVRARLEVTMGTRQFGQRRLPEVRVRFRAPVAITDAQRMYLFEGRFPASRAKRCRHVIFSTPTARNIARGEVVKVFGTIPPECTGTLRARVVFADSGYTNGKPEPGVVGQVVRRFR